ncbi:MAG: hypothetical protein ACUVV4_08500 [Candidatus Bathyarchaeia archaeon]
MGEKGGVEYPAFNISLITLLAIALIGVFSLFAIYQGLQSYNDKDMEQAYYYMLIGIFGFAAMGFMFFRSKTLIKSRLELPKAEVLTTIECGKCGYKIVRKFERGDYIFKNNIPCTKCDGMMTITKVHRKKKTEKELEKGFFNN